MKAAVGLCAHTGWAAATVVARDGKSARVVERRRLALLDADALANERFVYHLAMTKPLAEARALVKRVRETAEEHAAGALAALRRDLAARGVALVAAGLQLPNATRPLPEALEEILATHPLVHSVEGELYRSALAGACRGARLPLAPVPAREVEARLAAALRSDAAGARSWLADLGKDAGRPWAADQRQGACLAYVALLRS